MRDAVRSDGGCWTCRVRRKKCDEVMPICSTCTSLGIPCHGYGSKPTWMDRSTREREVAQELRDIVKRNLSFRRKGQLSDDFVPSAHTSETLTAESSATESSDIAKTSKQSIDSTTSNLVQQEIIGQPLAKDTWSVLPEPFGYDQAVLLMHFFDYVLPLQFPFYNPSVHEGGRGWLMSIIARTKPLYQVMLNLASYHQQSVLGKDGEVSYKVSLAELEERHIECIKLLRLHLGNIASAEAITTYEEHTDVMVCITFLIGLELFRGDTHDWQLHLQAASIFSIACRKGRLDGISPSRTQKLATEFFFTIISWYDILSCASTGAEPFLPLLGEIRFDKLMGCETWAMGLIAEIAQLSSQKRNNQRIDGSSVEEVEKAAEIKQRLELGQRDTATALEEESESRTHQITQIYASAASVYLHVMSFGPHPEIPEISQGVSKTMAAIDALTYRDHVRNLMWPICITGCMAKQEHESYWRNLVAGVSKERWSFGYPSKVLGVMEECWRLRKAGTLVDWLKSMESLDIRILLV